MYNTDMENNLFLVKTYGCQMNVHESEKLAGVMKDLGYQPTDDEKKASVIIFNTCCIRESAEQKIFAHIGDLKHLKKNNKDLIIAVCGCMAQESGTSESIKKKFPFVNILFGTHNLHEFKNYILTYKTTKKKIFEVWDKEQKIIENSLAYRTSGYNAWVNITYGCNNFCTYCIVPFVRGRERSRKMEDIILEVKNLVQKEGYKVITLLGQNVNSYGNDIEDEKVNFPNLLKELNLIEGDFKIKFLTSHPKDLSDELIEVIAQSKKISKVIHLPCQSGSTKILQAMNRRYTREHYLSLISKIKSKIPNAFLTSDFIVGFPGETEEDFIDTYSLVEHCGFNGIFAFMYSKRKGTVAEKMDNQIPIELKRARVNKLITLQREITKKQDANLCGKTFDAMIEKQIKDGLYFGRLESGKDVEIKGNAKVGVFQKVLITKVLNSKLQAELTGE